MKVSGRPAYQQDHLGAILVSARHLRCQEGKAAQPFCLQYVSLIRIIEITGQKSSGVFKAINAAPLFVDASQPIPSRTQNPSQKKDGGESRPQAARKWSPSSRRGVSSSSSRPSPRTSRSTGARPGERTTWREERQPRARRYALGTGITAEARRPRPSRAAQLKHPPPTARAAPLVRVAALVIKLLISRCTRRSEAGDHSGQFLANINTADCQRPDARRRVREICEKSPDSGAVPAHNSYSAVGTTKQGGNARPGPYFTFRDAIYQTARTCRRASQEAKPSPYSKISPTHSRKQRMSML